MSPTVGMVGACRAVAPSRKAADEATKELELEVCRRRWVEKAPRWSVILEAKRKLRNAKDERGDPKYTLHDWAAWVLTGEPD